MFFNPIAKFSAINLSVLFEKSSELTCVLNAAWIGSRPRGLDGLASCAWELSVFWEIVWIDVRFERSLNWQSASGPWRIGKLCLRMKCFLRNRLNWRAFFNAAWTSSRLRCLDGMACCAWELRGWISTLCLLKNTAWTGSQPRGVAYWDLWSKYWSDYYMILSQKINFLWMFLTLLLEQPLRRTENYIGNDFVWHFTVSLCNYARQYQKQLFCGKIFLVRRH